MGFSERKTRLDARRNEARTVSCPKCHSKKGLPCIGNRKTKQLRAQNHRERIALAIKMKTLFLRAKK